VNMKDIANISSSGPTVIVSSGPDEEIFAISYIIMELFCFSSRDRRSVMVENNKA
jgi:hypothetical protein